MSTVESSNGEQPSRGEEPIPPPWPLHPLPKEDEVITSWLMRFAAAQNLTPLALLAFLDDAPLKNFRPEGYEPYYARLASISGLSEARLRALVPAKDWHAVDRMRNSLYSCCPECLVTDPIPYLRRSWQHQDVFVCPVHRLMLSRQCFVCHTHWELRAFNPGTPTGPHDWSVCPNPRCGASVLESRSGELREDHPIFWL